MAELCKCGLSALMSRIPPAGAEEVDPVEWRWSSWLGGLWTTPLEEG